MNIELLHPIVNSFNIKTSLECGFKNGLCYNMDVKTKKETDIGNGCAWICTSAHTLQ